MNVLEADELCEAGDVENGYRWVRTSQAGTLHCPRSCNTTDTRPMATWCTAERTSLLIYHCVSRHGASSQVSPIPREGLAGRRCPPGPIFLPNGLAAPTQRVQLHDQGYHLHFPRPSRRLLGFPHARTRVPLQTPHPHSIHHHPANPLHLSSLPPRRPRPLLGTIMVLREVHPRSIPPIDIRHPPPHA